MKKALISILCAFLLSCLLALSVFASGVADTEQNQAQNQEITEGVSDFSPNGWDLRDYLIEKIAPVLVGVLTGVGALATTLGAIKKSLSSLKDAKKDLTDENAKNRELFLEQSSQLVACGSKMEDTSLAIEDLSNKIDTLEKQLYYLSEQSCSLAKIVTIGFLGDEKRVGSGTGEKMMLLLENSQGLLNEISRKIKELKKDEVK